MSTMQLIMVFVSLGVFVYSVYGFKEKPKEGENLNRKKRGMFLGLCIVSMSLVLGICFHTNQVASVNKEKASELASGITVQFKDDSSIKVVHRTSTGTYNVNTKNCKYEFEYHLDGSYIVGVKDVKQLSCKEKPNEK